MNLNYRDQEDQERYVEMGCYGIGINRLLATIIEQNNDKKGISWNKEVSVFENAVILAVDEEELVDKACELYQSLGEEKTLFYGLDSRLSVGEQFRESDLLGIQKKYILGNKYLEEEKIEVEKRDGSKEFVEEI